VIVRSYEWLLVLVLCYGHVVGLHKYIFSTGSILTTDVVYLFFANRRQCLTKSGVIMQDDVA
jgi:hypothetical protein